MQCAQKRTNDAAYAVSAYVRNARGAKTLVQYVVPTPTPTTYCMQ
jgi:hypothetical protein